MIVFIKCMPGLGQSVFFYNTCIQYSHLSLFLRQRIENYYLLLPEALLVGWDFEQTKISFFHQYLFLPAPVFLRSTGWDERTSILLIVWNSIISSAFPSIWLDASSDECHNHCHTFDLRLKYYNHSLMS